MSGNMMVGIALALVIIAAILGYFDYNTLTLSIVAAVIGFLGYDKIRLESAEALATATAPEVIAEKARRDEIEKFIAALRDGDSHSINTRLSDPNLLSLSEEDYEEIMNIISEGYIDPNDYKGVSVNDHILTVEMLHKVFPDKVPYDSRALYHYHGLIRTPQISDGNGRIIHQGSSSMLNLEANPIVRHKWLDGTIAIFKEIVADDSATEYHYAVIAERVHWLIDLYKVNTVEMAEFIQFAFDRYPNDRDLVLRLVSMPRYHQKYTKYQQDGVEKTKVEVEPMRFTNMNTGRPANGPELHRSMQFQGLQHLEREKQAAVEED